MSNMTFDYLIKKALTEGEKTTGLNPYLLSEVKSRLLKEGRYIKIMEKLNFICGTGFRKAATASCSIITILVLSLIFIQPVRAVAEKGIEKVKSMIYDVIKGEDGKYVAVRVPEIDPKDMGKVNIKGVEQAVEKEIIARIPKNLAGGYKFFNQSLASYDASTGSMMGVSVSDPIDEKTYEKFNEMVSTFYKKDNSLIVLSVSHFDVPFVWNSRREIFEGDNEKTIYIGPVQATYAEYPSARYPLKEIDKNRNFYADRTKKPVINIVHRINWEQNGIYYSIYDFTHDLSMEELKIAAESVIKSMM